MAACYASVPKGRRLRYFVLFAILFTIHKKVECNWNFKSGGGSGGGGPVSNETLFGAGDNFFEIPANDPGWELFCHSTDAYMYPWCEPSPRYSVGGTRIYSRYRPFTQDVYLFGMIPGRYNMGTRFPFRKGFQSTGVWGGLYISGNFDDPAYYQWRGEPHWAIDVPAAIGTYVYAVAAGTIAELDDLDARFPPRFGCGKYIGIRHNAGSYTYYCHLSNFLGSKQDDPVVMGTPIALSGNTGLSGGAHIHYAWCRQQGGTAAQRMPWCVNPLEIGWY